MVLVRLLGPVEVTDAGGTAHPVGSALRRTLLALLALRAGEMVTADWLLENVWAGDPPESGLRALRFHVSRLRKELDEDGLIETRPGGYRLAISADQVDALATQRMADAARRENDPFHAAEMYGEALRMWHGEPFADAAPCAVLDDEAGRLDALRLAIIEDHFRARLDVGGGRELVADLSRATAQFPLRESLWSLLIIAQYRAGLQADALRSYEQMRTMLSDDLGLDPSRELQDLQRRVLQHDPSIGGAGIADSDDERDAPRRAPRTLPEPASTLIDSTDQLGAAKRLVRDHRLVTLAGAGGIGKTRLAVELGRSCLDQFNDGVWMVELAPIANPDSVLGAVASTLSIPLQHGMTDIDSIIDWFSGRRAMLIFDNCEHVLDAARPLLNRLVERCPTMTFLATSRQPLEVSGERVLMVNVLSPEVDGVALFLDRASAADSSFVANDEDRKVVADICRRLDGLPLAIELAARRFRWMSLAELLERLDDRFALLRRAGSGMDHHDVLHETVEWSYRLLSDREQAVFDQLSVFAGSFDLVAADAVCGKDNVAGRGVVDALIALVDRSMIVADRRPDGTRYYMLETMRQFGDKRLRDGAELRAAR